MTTDPKDTVLRNFTAQSAVELETARIHLQTAQSASEPHPCSPYQPAYQRATSQPNATNRHSGR